MVAIKINKPFWEDLILVYTNKSCLLYYSIEHLTFDDLEKLPAALFGVVKPRIVVVTTPNAEYNVLFPNFVGFRHPDHKFEWTRSEFSDW